MSDKECQILQGLVNTMASFSASITAIRKREAILRDGCFEYLDIEYDDPIFAGSLALPYFEADTLYTSMKLESRYTPSDLGLTQDNFIKI